MLRALISALLLAVAGVSGAVLIVYGDVAPCAVLAGELAARDRREGRVWSTMGLDVEAAYRRQVEGREPLQCGREVALLWAARAGLGPQ